MAEPINDINVLIHRMVTEVTEKVDQWLRATILKELGEEWYLKSDMELAEEFKKRGYKLVYRQTVPSAHEVWDKDNNLISAFVIRTQHLDDYKDK